MLFRLCRKSFFFFQFFALFVIFAFFYAPNEHDEKDAAGDGNHRRSIDPKRCSYADQGHTVGFFRHIHHDVAACKGAWGTLPATILVKDKGAYFVLCLTYQIPNGFGIAAVGALVAEYVNELFMLGKAEAHIFPDILKAAFRTEAALCQNKRQALGALLLALQCIGQGCIGGVEAGVVVILHILQSFPV